MHCVYIYIYIYIYTQHLCYVGPILFTFLFPSGDLQEESELLTWLLYQMKEDTIENINRDLLLKMMDKFEFLAVFFCK